MMLASPPPLLQRFSLSWIVVGLGLIAPWIWLTVLDRLLRRTR
jgi:hypothetical protein